MHKEHKHNNNMEQGHIEIGRLTKAAYLPKPRVNSWWFMTDDKCQPIVHFCYKVESIADEVEMRSALLGRSRRSEEAAHLLDLIAMTKDEIKLFWSLAQKAAARVFDVLEKYTYGIEDAMKIDDGIHYVLRIPYSSNENNVKTADNAIFEALVDCILFEWLTISYPSEAENYLAKANNDLQILASRLGNYNQSIVQKVPRIL